MTTQLPATSTGATDVIRPRTVVILLFPGVELLDFAGPYEVFSVAARLTDPPAFHVTTTAERPGPTATQNGICVHPHTLLADCPRADLLVIPGGRGARQEMHNEVLTGWIRRRAAEAERVLSVCTGSLLLGRAGLLDGLKATTHHGAYELLLEAAPKARLIRGPRYVDNGKVVTSAGISAGIEAAFHVVRGLLGKGVAERTARHMEYPWPGA